METMRISERKKSSKGIIIGLLVFFILGGSIIFLALKSEKEPPIVGKSNSDIDRLVDLEDKSVETSTNNQNTSFGVTDKKITDKTNSKIKGDLTLPVISINSEELTDLNKEIYDKYTSQFSTSKEQLAKAENKYTYKVTYNVYENTVGNTKIVSITVFQRTIDDASGKNSTEKVDTYNIDVATKNQVQQNAIATEMFGVDYKTKIKNAVKSQVISKNMIKEEDYTYAITGLENFYIKDSKFHIYFNGGEIVDQKYGMLDITVE